MYKQIVSYVPKDIANIIIGDYLHPHKTKKEIKLMLLTVLTQFRMKRVLQDIKTRPQTP